VTLAWDNLSENSPDPVSGWFDFRGYKIWKVSDWTRPVGTSGPSEDDWTLLAEYRLFDGAPDNKRLVNGVPVCPRVYIPQKRDSVEICLTRGDLWDFQSGDVIHPDASLPCVGFPNCVVDSALQLGSTSQRVGRTRYPVGRYRYVDHQVKNGFPLLLLDHGARLDRREPDEGRAERPARRRWKGRASHRSRRRTRAAVSGWSRTPTAACARSRSGPRRGT
jgi:hypothetical protein